MNILDRINRASSKNPINSKVHAKNRKTVKTIDYRPSLKHKFRELAESWWKGVLNGELGKEDKFTLFHPDKAYLETGGL